MHAISNLWWLWLLCLICFGGYTLANQLRRMKGVLAGANGLNMNRSFDSFSQGLASLFICAFLAWISGILLAIAVLIKLFDK
jgi:hypothetical protein